MKASRRLDAHAGLALVATLLLWAGAPPESPVADAAMRGDGDQVRQLLRSGADVNAAQGDGMTALHWAAERRDAPMAEVLLAAGANPAATTRLGEYTPLHIAAKSGADGAARALLDAGANPEARTSTGGAAPLHFAAGAGDARVVEALVSRGTDVDVREEVWLQTPLMFAAAGGHVEVVRALLASGADPAITARVMDMDEREQLDRADRRQQEELQSRIRAAQEGEGAAPVQLAGAGPTVPGQGAANAQQGPSREEINAQQRDRRPSSRFSHAQLVGGYGGLAALHLAVRDGRTGAALALLDGGADVDQVSGGDHTSALLMATINGHFDLAMELFERGADPTLASDANASPLYAVINTQWIPKSRHPQPADYMQQQVTYVDLARAFLDAGVDPNVRLTKQLWFTTFGDDYLRVDRMGATPFWRAAYALDLPMMKLLVEYGADPNVPTMKTAPPRFGAGGLASNDTGEGDPSGLPPVPIGGPGVYPIHAASGVGYGEGFAANIHRVVPDGWLPAVRYLVEEMGADVNQRDHNGYTAMHHAAARGDNELIEYLVEQGGDVMVVARTGQTTVDMANGPVQRISPFPATIALLESLGAVNNHNCVAC
jgi:ankyrin repeat protein